MFIKYVMIGILNTALHWAVFFTLHSQAALSQSFSNLYAFIVAVTFSFFCNARFTFQDRPTLKRYLLFTSFMGFLSWLTGYLGDRLHIAPLLTVMAFSLISLIMGFFYSKYIVFRSAA
ncbi:GtrA family protein [Edwardsiella piscicida]|uniref:GtrA family protein n=1 Tax=Edwardsiella piscicida TaxID=1263550 RepID=UPI00084C1EDA|nr:GtrA family protein [Edwardsiella piscicida]AOP43193.1 GtrA family protein [Edwardsiella piscicida]EKS7765777.1 GtrA family protein [Edwardsiella piscicida]EKS7793638.1 GtrA family protein [Edwardsiella piscicida]EKS7813292.1 GtrA family protein [Edwardsiella piscicida]ELM3723735.1 GtrA family protein [Edwardsiella piscicida]